jgi:nucleoside diphosphate kinase
MMPIQKVFVLLKPDCLMRNLVEDFLSGLSQEGLSYKNLQRVTITREIAKVIYRDCLDKHFYGDLEDFIFSNPCMVMIVSGDDAICKVLKLKKVFRKKHKLSWINLTEEDLSLWENGTHQKQHELNLKLRAENLLHSTDTETEADEIIGLLYPLET